MGTGRFLLLWEAALRRQAQRQLRAIEAALFKNMEEGARKTMMDSLFKQANLGREEIAEEAQRRSDEEKWEQGWSQLSAMAGKQRAGG
jgi:hypothetical protein